MTATYTLYCILILLGCTSFPPVFHPDVCAVCNLGDRSDRNTLVLRLVVLVQLLGTGRFGVFISALTGRNVMHYVRFALQYIDYD